MINMIIGDQQGKNRFAKTTESQTLSDKFQGQLVRFPHEGDEAHIHEDEVNQASFGANTWTFMRSACSISLLSSAAPR